MSLTLQPLRRWWPPAMDQCRWAEPDADWKTARSGCRHRDDGPGTSVDRRAARMVVSREAGLFREKLEMETANWPGHRHPDPAGYASGPAAVFVTGCCSQSGRPRPGKQPRCDTSPEKKSITSTSRPG